jgi:glycosyltransferase 2 family protein
MDMPLAWQVISYFAPEAQIVMSALSAAPYLKVGVTAVLLALVFRTVEPSKLIRDLARLQPATLAVVMAGYWLGQIICSQRWRLFASGLGMGGKLGRFIQMYFVGMFFNASLPSLIGGDAVKAYMIARSTGQPLRLGVASVLQDRAVGWVTLIVFGSAAALWCPLVWRGISIRALYLLVWIGMAAAIAAIWKGERLYARYIVPGGRSLLQRVLKTLLEFHQALGTMRLSRGGFLQVTAISFANSALVLWLYREIAVAVGQQVSLAAFTALIPLITIATMMPISLGGLGIREWAYVEALALVGMSRSGALLVALTTSALMILVNLGGALFLPTIPKELRRGSEDEAPAQGNPPLRRSDQSTDLRR